MFRFAILRSSSWERIKLSHLIYYQGQEYRVEIVAIVFVCVRVCVFSHIHPFFVTFTASSFLARQLQHLFSDNLGLGLFFVFVIALHKKEILSKVKCMSGTTLQTTEPSLANFCLWGNSHFLEIGRSCFPSIQAIWFRLYFHYGRLIWSCGDQKHCMPMATFVWGIRCLWSLRLFCGVRWPYRTVYPIHKNQ